MNNVSHVSRRRAVGLLATSPLAVMMHGGAVAPARAVAFELVHGAWHGGWCWKKVTPLLRAAGHEVFAPTLTGCGERVHLATRDVGLDTHVTDIVQVLEYEDLHDVVLVGHSYGGMVIAGVADKAAPRLSQLVYLDAFLPENGKALSDYAARPPLTGDAWQDPPRPPEGFGVKDERDIAWMTTRLTAMPRKCMTQPVPLSTGAGSAIKGAFIQCTTSPFFAEAGARAKRNGYQYREMLSAGHDAMVTQPDVLSKLLIELGSRRLS